MKIEQISTPTHETVMSCNDPESGLQAFIAVHDTTLGPSLGGCRMWKYDSAADALADVLRLSAGMTAKAALVGVPFGGGKAVIMGDPHTEKTPEKMRAFGRFVEALGGRYISAEDVGMSPADMMIAAQETSYMTGLPDGPLASGDPSPYTAELVFRCMKSALLQVFGASDLIGRRVAVQGLGHVGRSLAERLHQAGAQLIVADINAEATGWAAGTLGAEIADPQAIHRAEAEIFAPCALGGTLNAETIPEISAAIVCGSANNQLAVDADADRLAARGMLYCPDYVVNSGGLLSVAREALKVTDLDWTLRKLDTAAEKFSSLLAFAQQKSISPVDAADQMVEAILHEARQGPSKERNGT
ncbi:Glu/Leu/Phe/Val dehydrogenase dimerization domain-containing protein [Actibacterium pelagium]|uniref:Leucine dehydrogenase n=1 Tax=Actibacterium pelagium TaxID=2029103 RepID=A0A917EHZ6_9RHOB|nr:Glu/Leu/Phe/Val dehydrogenase dimerization domain-containing protein [Actibacterium pelagium]GGE37266.1 leucine dehydrogenase [Actibacterium pelagium]